MYWVRTLFFVTVLAALFILSPLAEARHPRPKGFETILFNPKELEDLVKKYGVTSIKSIDYNELSRASGATQTAKVWSGQNPLCLDLGSECLMLSTITSFEIPENDYVFSLEPNKNSQNTAEKAKCHYFQVLLAHDGYLSFDTLKRRDESKIKKALSGFFKGKISYEEMEQAVLRSPRGFEILPKIYSAYREKNIGILNGRDTREKFLIKSTAREVERLILRTLFLTLDALRNQATSPSPLYQFSDKMISKDQLLDISKMYRDLTNKYLWPDFLSLTPQERSNAPAIFRELNTANHYKVRGSYDINANIIWLDFSADYFETLYILQHELWHAYWRNSNRGNTDNWSIETLLNEGSDAELVQYIEDMVSRNELLGLDQQIRLYHAAGPTTELWSKVDESAQGWHDSYYGDGIYQFFMSRSKRWMYESYRDADKTFAPGLSTLVKALLRILGASSELNVTNFMGLVAPSKSYFESQIQAHKNKFERKYLNGMQADLRVDSLLRIADPNGLSGETPVPVHLTCDQLRRSQKLIEGKWEYGLPFMYEVSDPQNCPDLKVPDSCSANDNVYPGTGGTHPGTGGTHPGTGGTHPGTGGTHPSVIFEGGD